MGTTPIGGPAQPSPWEGINLPEGPINPQQFIDIDPSILAALNVQGEVNTPQLGPPLVQTLRLIDEAIRNLEEVLEELLRADSEKSQEFQRSNAARANDWFLLIDEYIESRDRTANTNQPNVDNAAEALNDEIPGFEQASNDYNVARENFLNSTTLQQLNDQRQVVLDAYASGDPTAYAQAAQDYNALVQQYNQEVSVYNAAVNTYNNAVNSYNGALINYINQLRAANQEIQARNEANDTFDPLLNLPDGAYINPGAGFDPLDPNVPASQLGDALIPTTPSIGLAGTIPTTRPGTAPIIPVINPTIPDAVGSTDIPPLPVSADEPAEDPAEDAREEESGSAYSQQQQLFNSIFSKIFTYSTLFDIALGIQAGVQDEEIIRRLLSGGALLNKEEMNAALIQSVTSPGAAIALSDATGLKSSQLEGILGIAVLATALDATFNREQRGVPLNLYDRVQQPLVNALFRSALLSFSPSSSVALSLGTTVANRSESNLIALSLGLSSQLISLAESGTLLALLNDVASIFPISNEAKTELVNNLTNVANLFVQIFNLAQLDGKLGTEGLLFGQAGFLLAGGDLESIKKLVGTISAEQKSDLIDQLTTPIQQNLVSAGVSQTDAERLAVLFATNFAEGQTPQLGDVSGFTPAETSQLLDLLTQTALIGIVTASFAKSVEDYSRIVTDSQRFVERQTQLGTDSKTAEEIAELLAQIKDLNDLRNALFSISAYGEPAFGNAVTAISFEKVRDRIEEIYGTGPQAQLLVENITTQVGRSQEILRESISALDERGESAIHNEILKSYTEYKTEDIAKFLQLWEDPAKTFVGLIYEGNKPQVEGLSGAEDRDLDVRI